MTTPALTALESRQIEVDQYSANITMYTAILATLPTEWPARLLNFKGSKSKHEDIAKVEDLADVELLAQLWQADDCKAAIRTETLERTKAASILAVLQMQTL